MGVIDEHGGLYGLSLTSEPVGMLCEGKFIPGIEHFWRLQDQ